MNAKIGLGVFVLLFFLVQKAEAHRDVHMWGSGILYTDKN